MTRPRTLLRVADQLGENLASALGSIAVAKGRSGLTVLGVVIGVATVMAMATIVSGIRDQIVDTIEIAGPTTFYVLKVWSQTPVNPQNLPAWIRIRPDLTTDDAERVAKLPGDQVRVDLGTDSESDGVRRHTDQHRRRDGRRRRVSRDLRRRADRRTVVHAQRAVERRTGDRPLDQRGAQTIRRHSAASTNGSASAAGRCTSSASTRKRRTSFSRPGRRSTASFPTGRWIARTRSTRRTRCSFPSSRAQA